MRLWRSGGSNGRYFAVLGNGDGTFSTTDTSTAVGSFYGSNYLVGGDFNGDGKMDFAAIGTSAFSVGTDLDVYLYDNAHPGPYTSSYRYIFPGNPDLSFNLVAGDFFGDGKQSIAVVGKPTSNNPSQLYLLRGNGSGTFTRTDIKVGGLLRWRQVISGVRPN